MPALTRSCEGARGEVLAVEGDAAGLGRHQAGQAFQQRGLADAVAAEQRGHLADRRLEGLTSRRMWLPP
jgi:hypothetical protein